MSESFKAIKNRLTLAITVIKTRNNAKLIIITREFNVSRERLRTRLNEHLFMSDLREMHNKALTPAQKLALRKYIIILNKIHISARLHMIQITANDLC